MPALVANQQKVGAFCCHRLALLRLSSWRGRVFTFWGNYGRRFGFACQNHLRKCEPFYPVLRLVFWCGFGLLLFPLAARAEWQENDRTALFSIQERVGNCQSYLNAIENYVSDLPTDMEREYKLLQWLVWGSTVTTSNPNLHALVSSINSYMSSLGENSATIAEKTTKLAENSDSVLTKLDEIIAALEALESSGGSSSGGSGIVQDWVKEDTFSAYNDWFKRAYGFNGNSSSPSLYDFMNEQETATQTYRDWFKSAFGFGGTSSSPSLYNMLFNNRDFYSLYYYPGELTTGQIDTPYPVNDGSKAYWRRMGPVVSALPPGFFKDVKSLPTYLSFTFAQSLSQFGNGLLNNLEKHSWNDYYAHTNLVANLWAIHNSPPPTGETPTIGFNEGVLTYKDGSGSSGSSAPTTQTLDLNPAATNSYNSVVGDIKDVTGAITGGTHTGDNPIDTDAIRARYFAYLDIKGASTEIGDDVGSASSSGETLKISFMGVVAEIDLAAWGTSYRNIMTFDRLKTWRGAMGIIWMLASWVGGFYLVKRLANME